jgi:chromosome segregation ATPase
MAKLINILVASFGGGLVLGAGIRLGEALASREAAGASEHTTGAPARMAARMEEQAAEVSAIRAALAAESRQIEALSELGVRLHRELPDCIEKSVARRIEEAEADLKAESGRSREEALEAVIEGVQTRVAHRISRLEEEVSMHSAAMTELLAYSLRTEASIEKLAVSLDRLLAAQSVFPGRGTAPAAAEAPPVKEAPAAAEERPARSRRWGIFR